MIGLGAWTTKIFYAATADRSTFKLANLFVFTVGALNCLWIVFDLNQHHGLNELKQFVSWIVLST